MAGGAQRSRAPIHTHLLATGDAAEIRRNGNRGRKGRGQRWGGGGENRREGKRRLAARPPRRAAPHQGMNETDFATASLSSVTPADAHHRRHHRPEPGPRGDAHLREGSWKAPARLLDRARPAERRSHGRQVGKVVLRRHQVTRGVRGMRTTSGCVSRNVCTYSYGVSCTRDRTGSAQWSEYAYAAVGMCTGGTDLCPASRSCPRTSGSAGRCGPGRGQPRSAEVS